MPSPGRPYYSQRTAGSPRIELSVLVQLFGIIYRKLETEHYLDEAFGYNCVDADDVPGTLGADREGAVLLALRKPGVWPVAENASSYTEADLFDVIEFLFDHVSEPLAGYHHDYGGCGWHYETFDKVNGQARLRAEVNGLLRDYGEGFELSPDGEVLARVPSGIEPLLGQPLPTSIVKDTNQRVEAAVRKFRRHSSSVTEKRDAVRDLADILEYVRPQLPSVITSKDESDLFNIANNFAIRHHNDRQKSDYDSALWLPWMFYVYLSTVHVSLRILERSAVAPP